MARAYKKDDTRRIRIPDDVWEKVVEVAMSDGRTASSYVRTLLKDHLNLTTKPKKK